MELSRFERMAIEKLVSGDVDEITLLEQLNTASVIDRNCSGVGIFVKLRVNERAPRIHTPARVVSRHTVLLRHPRLENEGGAVLFIKDSVMDMLECFTTGEDWPADEKLFEVEMAETSTRQ